MHTSLSNSDANIRCLIKGCDKGDSSIGSIGSNGLIKCASMKIFGSETSSTDNEFGLQLGSLVSGEDAGSF